MSDELARLLDWDSTFWDVPIARVQGDRMTDERLAAIDTWCAERGVACAYFLARIDDPETTQAAERGGFFCTDVRVTLSMPLANRRDLAAPPATTREATAGDHAELAAIARVSHETTRFYHDPRFDRDRCGELYVNWLESSYDTVDRVIVAEEEGRVAGYLTCEVENGTGAIGLLAVAAQNRGHGLGAAMLSAGLERFEELGVEHSVVVTQARNIDALRLFGRAGYLVEAAHLWFHKWYDS
jgi:dTDP-4-amino-4,6-dideoxy-D-galactose acyltransferase